MALAVLAAAGLNLMIPADFRLNEATSVGYPVLLLLLLAALVVGDPGRIDRDRPWLRIMTGIMIGLITLSVAVSAVRLVVGILEKASFDSAGQLLSLGAAVWSTNVIAFALWYWHLDSGGPVARANSSDSGPPAFHFPEQSLESFEGTGWYPQFVDYLALSFNTATAFSPTDVSAIRPWSKLWLIAESAISLALGALVIAQAINML